MMITSTGSGIVEVTVLKGPQEHGYVLSLWTRGAATVVEGQEWVVRLERDRKHSTPHNARVRIEG